MKQTPEIVIPAKKIICCADCPFFVCSDESWHYTDFFCDRANKIFGNSYKGFLDAKQKDKDAVVVWPDQDIWIHCPLPDVKEEN